MDRDRTARYVLGDLDPPERVAFEERLRHDSRLRAEVAALQGVLRDVRALPESAPDPDAEAHAAARGEARARRAVVGRWVAAGAAALACVGAGVGLGLAIAGDPAPERVNPRMVLPMSGSTIPGR